ncbi:unnamed protein product [Phaeothamnion confervicola]
MKRALLRVVYNIGAVRRGTSCLLPARRGGQRAPLRRMSNSYIAGSGIGKSVATMTTTAESKHTNRLAAETSPYLLQHAHNPVDWYPWGEAAFEKARAEDKPIFLSVGYSTCHWCHVMERESFESEEVAAILNKQYVPVKVDREERPDVDAVYMNFVQAKLTY